MALQRICSRVCPLLTHDLLIHKQLNGIRLESVELPALSCTGQKLPHTGVGWCWGSHQLIWHMMSIASYCYSAVLCLSGYEAIAAPFGGC